MNLMDRKQQEEFFLDYLTRMLPQGRSVHVAESSYEEERSAMLYRTSAGPLVVCINDIEKPETDVPHRTGFIARLLSEIGQKNPRSTSELQLAFSTGPMPTSTRRLFALAARRSSLGIPQGRSGRALFTSGAGLTAGIWP